MALTTTAPTSERIGRYQLIGKLGEGSLSVVYKAFDPTSKRKLAVKILRDEHAMNPVNRDLFLAEAKAAGKLTHANIATVFDVGDDDKKPFIAMEYLQEETLDEVLNSGEKLSTRDILSIGIQLAEALEYSHNQGIIHRDIRPGNIFISADRQQIRITDFGIAHIQHLQLEPQADPESLHSEPHYLSPEQIEGLDIDGRSDLFSTGILLYQLITGERPFQAPSRSQLLMQIAEGKPSKIKENVPDVVPDVQKIVEKLLSKEKKQRFRTSAELADALQIAQVALDQREKTERKKRNSTLPLHYRWTLILAIVLFISLVFAGLFIYDRQVDSMSKLSLEFGGKLARFISMESAEAVLAQDWIAIEMITNDAQKYHVVNYLDILDINGVTRSGEAQSSAALKQIRDIEQLPSLTGTGMLISEKSMEGETIIEFDAPILFQDREVGRVRLGVPQTSLISAAEQTVATLLSLLPAIMMIVLAVVWLLTSRLRAVLMKLAEGLDLIGQKRYDVRLIATHNNELGQLFINFNSMAETLEQGQDEEDASLGVIEVPLTTLEASLDDHKIEHLPDETSLARGEKHKTQSSGVTELNSET